MTGTNDGGQLQIRTKRFALAAVRLFESLPRTASAQIVGKQLLRSALSVGANYRAACRARSRRDFVAKLGIVEEEADEARYWMEILSEGGLMKPGRLSPLMAEAGEIAAMVVASIRTARAGPKQPRPLPGKVGP